MAQNSNGNVINNLMNPQYMEEDQDQQGQGGSAGLAQQPQTVEQPPSSITSDPNYIAWSKQNPGVPYSQSPFAPGAAAPNGVTGNSGNDNITAGPAKPASTNPTIPDTWKVGANTANPKGMVLGFDTGKLNDPNYTSAKYTKAAKVFSQGIAANVGVSRGGLGNMVMWAQNNGFPNAKVVGDDKIDFGDGNGPIDVIRSDGQIVFQNGGGGGSVTPTTSNVPSNGQGTYDGGLTDYLGGISNGLTTGVSSNLQDLLAKYYGLNRTGMQINTGSGISGNGQ